MKYSLKLASATHPDWVRTVLSDFPAFFQDHADCERKASAMAMSFVAKYPDRVEIIPELVETAIEELGHFQLVYAHMAKRGIRLAKEMSEDPYIKRCLSFAIATRSIGFSTACCSPPSSNAAAPNGSVSFGPRWSTTRS